MRVLITGGAGFLGRWLQVALAQENHQVWAPSSTELDVRDAAQCRYWVELAAPEWVFHLAGVPRRSEIERAPELCMDVAVSGTRNVLQAVRENRGGGSRVVVTSSCHVYGAPQRVPIEESHPLNPASIYGVSKGEMEATVAEADDLDVMVARLFHLVGPGQSQAFAVSSWALQSRTQLGPVDVGALDLERDYLDVRDGAAALLVLAERGGSQQVYNVCSGAGVSLRWLFDQVTDGRESRVDPRRLRADDPARVVGDSSKLKALGWAPAVALETSLADLSLELDA
ncbi:MAG: NAD-dependent epimerase/dehydratase family protein [Myxococcota bacterium]|nr:NAD-dependent epimerase/dehydratase family protein [Myxococcota bacterium]